MSVCVCRECVVGISDSELDSEEFSESFDRFLTVSVAWSVSSSEVSESLAGFVSKFFTAFCRVSGILFVLFLPNLLRKYLSVSHEKSWNDTWRLFSSLYNH